MGGRGGFAPALSCVFYRLWVGGAVAVCVLAGCVVCAWWGVLLSLVCLGVVGVLLRVGVVCSRLLLPRVFLFVCGLLVFVGVGFSLVWCGFLVFRLFLFAAR